MSTLYHRAAARIDPANDNRLPASVSSGGGVPVGWPSLARMVAEWRRRLRSRQTLAGLSAYELRDIGLTVHDQARECAKPFWRG
jgi:uncharacterized protein YjiS (DUF1127 family)